MTPRSLRGGLLAASLLAFTACGPADSVEAVPVPVPVHVEETPAPVYGLPPSPPSPPAPPPELPEAAPSAEPEAENYQPARPMEAVARYGLAPMPNGPASN